MKGLTVCQPYASLIARGEKRVENRTWPTRYRGLLAIHAGKSREWLTPEWKGHVELDASHPQLGPIDQMPFGAVIALARLVDCIHIDRIAVGAFNVEYPWLRQHEHAHGPYCWVLGPPVPIEPWPWRGSQGLFEIESAELDALAARTFGPPSPMPGLHDDRCATRKGFPCNCASSALKDLLTD